MKFLNGHILTGILAFSWLCFSVASEREEIEPEKQLVELSI
jgi:hypothetical protein